MPEGLFTWQMLATLTSASTLCYLIVAQLKKYLPQMFPTDLLAVAISFVILAAAVGFTAGLSLSDGCLCFFNAWLVAAVSGKMHDQAAGSKPGGPCPECLDDAAVTKHIGGTS